MGSLGVDIVDKDLGVAVNDLAGLDNYSIRFRQTHKYHAIRNLMVFVEWILQIQKREEPGWGSGAWARLPTSWFVETVQVILWA